MQYKKHPLTFDEQADLLIKRGLIAEKLNLIHALERISYYRLSGYLYPFRQPDDSDFYIEGTTLEKICRRYAFDRQLRVLVLDAIERVEISVRTDLVYHFSHKYGAFGYCDPTPFIFLTLEKHQALLGKMKKEKDISKDRFVKHFNDTYGDQHEYLPLWMAAEVMSFGTMLTFYRGIEPKMKREISRKYEVSHETIFSWIIALNGIRNICAHHGRLWNRVLGYRPLIPLIKKHPDWHVPETVSNDRIYSIVTILRYLLKIIAPQSQWSKRFTSLMERYQDIPRLDMGFSENWRECPIWKND